MHESLQSKSLLTLRGPGIVDHKRSTDHIWLLAPGVAKRAVREAITKRSYYEVVQLELPLFSFEEAMLRVLRPLRIRGLFENQTYNVFRI